MIPNPNLHRQKLLYGLAVSFTVLLGIFAAYRIGTNGISATGTPITVVSGSFQTTAGENISSFNYGTRVKTVSAGIVQTEQTRLIVNNGTEIAIDQNNPGIQISASGPIYIQTNNSLNIKLGDKNYPIQSVLAVYHPIDQILYLLGGEVKLDDQVLHANQQALRQNGQIMVKDIDRSLFTNELYWQELITLLTQRNELPAIMSDLTPPNLTIANNIPAKVTDPRLLISGQSENDTKLMINNQEVLVDSSGKFTHTYTLNSGVNRIQIIAADKFNNKTIKEYTVTLGDSNQSDKCASIGNFTSQLNCLINTARIAKKISELTVNQLLTQELQTAINQSDSSTTTLAVNVNKISTANQIIALNGVEQSSGAAYEQLMIGNSSAVLNPDFSQISIITHRTTVYVILYAPKQYPVSTPN